MSKHKGAGCPDQRLVQSRLRSLLGLTQGGKPPLLRLDALISERDHGPPGEKDREARASNDSCPLTRPGQLGQRGQVAITTGGAAIARERGRTHREIREVNLDRRAPTRRGLSF